MEDSKDKNIETQEVDDTQRVHSDIESHEFVDGIMKIVPPDLDVSPNFFSLKLFHHMHIRRQHIGQANLSTPLNLLVRVLKLNSLII